MKARRLAQREGWVCWLCDGAIDPDLPPNSRYAATVDHVVPRSRGGRTEPDNLRLAHRWCNTNRADTLPELDWPSEFAPLDTTDLWTVIARLHRRGQRRAKRRRRNGDRADQELAGMFPTEELARRAAVWAVERAEAFVGGSFEAEVSSTGAADVHVVRLSGEGFTDPGRPRRGRDGSDPGRPRRGRRPVASSRAVHG